MFVGRHAHGYIGLFLSRVSAGSLSATAAAAAAADTRADSSADLAMAVRAAGEKDHGTIC